MIAEYLPVYRFFRNVQTVFDDTAKVGNVEADATLENPDSGDSFTMRVARIRFMVRVGDRRERRGLILYAEQEQTEFDVSPLEIARRVFVWLNRPDAVVPVGERFGQYPLRAFTDEGTYWRSLGCAVPW